MQSKIMHVDVEYGGHPLSIRRDGRNFLQKATPIPVILGCDEIITTAQVPFGPSAIFHGMTDVVTVRTGTEKEIRREIADVISKAVGYAYNFRYDSSMCTVVIDSDLADIISEVQKIIHSNHGLDMLKKLWPEDTWYLSRIEGAPYSVRSLGVYLWPRFNYTSEPLITFVDVPYLILYPSEFSRMNGDYHKAVHR